MKKSILLVLGNLIKRDLGPTLVKKSEEHAEKALEAEKVEKALRAEELLKQQDAEQKALDTEDAEKVVDTEQVEDTEMVEDEFMDTLYGPAPGEGPDTADTI